MKLVYLSFASNTAYCCVTDTPPEGVTVDVEKGEWRIEHRRGWLDSDSVYLRSHKIGSARYIRHWRGGIIGVFDAEQTAHMNAMVHATVDAQREKCSSVDEY
ncbi:MAG: hypothetical protein KBD21_04240 [Candidatus Pacebacteria bacterium]|nr:hypothetical protein [Candidatus Paceibacterota bacterium]